MVLNELFAFVLKIYSVTGIYDTENVVLPESGK